jgi:hypothetical protein
MMQPGTRVLHARHARTVFLTLAAYLLDTGQGVGETVARRLALSAGFAARFVF